jgi:serine/threonine protein kinase
MEKTVLKTMRYMHDYTPRNYDRHRRDAVAMERLSSSPFIMDIYAFCGNSGLFEYADGGSLSHSVFAEEEEGVKPWDSKEKLVVAHQAAAGLAALHNTDKEGVASIAHTDITTSQFVYVEEAGIFKLNDFNRCRFIAWNNKTNKPCTYEVGNNPGKVRRHSLLDPLLITIC